MKVILVAAISLDGRISQLPTRSSFSWTSKEDQNWFQSISKKIGVLIMGRKTFTTINKPFPDRRLIVLTTNPERYQDLTKPGSLEFTNLPLETLLKRLAKQGLSSVLIAGGSSVYSESLQKDLVDELWLTLEPIVFGQGVPWLETEMTIAKLKLEAMKKLNQDTLLLKYLVCKTPTGAIKP